ncbi:MAG: hypothetical protein Q8M99_09125 [Methylotenera sp.]|nr:hypothetical protein [Methylotenera sp.]
MQGVAYDASELGISNTCYKDLPWHIVPHCLQYCLNSSILVCGSCLNSPPDFDATFCLFAYDFSLDAMMQC